MGRTLLVPHAALAAACVWRFAFAVGDPGKCLTLDRDSFDAHLDASLKSKRLCLVMMHVGWCKACQRAFPEFVKAANEASEQDRGVDFAHVDCTDDKTLCQRFGSTGYPSIKLFVPEADPTKPQSFRGQRSMEGFLRYAERMTQPPVRRIAGTEELEAAVNNETFAAFVASVPAEGDLPGGFLEAAKKWRDRHTFVAAVRMEDVLPKAVKVPKGASVAVYSLAGQQWPGRAPQDAAAAAAAFYTGDIGNDTAVEEWISGHRFPGVWQLTSASFYEFTHAERRTAVVAVDPETVSEVTEAAVRDAAASLHEDFFFGVVDGVGWESSLTEFNIYKEELPRVLVTENNADKWVEDIENLGVPSFKRDLGELLRGAPLLKQDGGLWAKIGFWWREAERATRRAQAYASQGTTQAVIMGLGVFLVGSGTLLCVTLCFWCGRAVFREIMEVPEPPNLRPRPLGPHPVPARPKAE